MQVIHNDPLDNQRKISQQSMKLPPMPKDLAKRERPSFRSVAREVMSAHNQPEPAPSAKESKISLRGAPPPASPVTKPSKTTPPETKTPPEPPLPKSQPPVRPRVKRGSKRASSVVKPPPTGNDNIKMG